MVEQSESKITYFTPSWFLKLFRGEFGLGDTFWAGSVGGQLIFVPFWVFTAIFAKMYSADMLTYTLLVASVFYAIYFVLLFRAIVATAIRNKTAEGWRWAGIFFGLLWALTAIILLFAAVEGFMQAG